MLEFGQRASMYLSREFLNIPGCFKLVIKNVLAINMEFRSSQSLNSIVIAWFQEFCILTLIAGLRPPALGKNNVMKEALSTQPSHNNRKFCEFFEAIRAGNCYGFYGGAF